MILKIVNKEKYGIKVRILENNKIKNSIKLYTGHTTIDILEGKNVTVVIKKLDNYLCNILKYILCHLNGVVNGELSKILKYEKIMFLSTDKNIEILYNSERTTLSGCQQYKYENKYNEMLGIGIGLFVFIILLLILYVWFIVI